MWLGQILGRAEKDASNPSFISTTPLPSTGDQYIKNKAVLKSNTLVLINYYVYSFAVEEEIHIHSSSSNLNSKKEWVFRFPITLEGLGFKFLGCRDIGSEARERSQSYTTTSITVVIPPIAGCPWQFLRTAVVWGSIAYLLVWWRILWIYCGREYKTGLFFVLLSDCNSRKCWLEAAISFPSRRHYCQKFAIITETRQNFTPRLYNFPMDLKHGHQILFMVLTNKNRVGTSDPTP